jgi:hypothetical protein
MSHTEVLSAGYLDVLEYGPQVIGVLETGVNEATAQHNVLKKVDDVFTTRDRVVVFGLDLRLGFFFRTNHTIDNYGNTQGQHR